MTKGRDVFGWIGLAVAILALSLALLPGWVSPAPAPEPGSGEGSWLAWLGSRMLHVPQISQAPIPPDVTTAAGVCRQRLATDAAVLGFVALVLGIVSFARYENARLTGCCVGVASGAIATQHLLTALLIMGFAVLTSSILARER
jgi:hypothetical protein